MSVCVGGGGGGCVRACARGRVCVCVCVHACEYFLSFFSFASHHFSVHFFLFFP